MKYTQCGFVSGISQTVAWIETKFAKVGNIVTMPDLSGDKRWKIVSCGAQKNEDPTLQYRTWNNNI